MNKTLITCAVTGNLVKPEHTPHLPITPVQIAGALLVLAGVLLVSLKIETVAAKV